MMKTFILILTVCLLNACALLPTQQTPTSNNSFDHHLYYAVIKHMDKSSLRAEIADIKMQHKQSNNAISPASIKLILLHILPSSPIHNIYSAKAIINLIEKREKESKHLPTTQGNHTELLLLLNDLLNQQLHLHQQSQDQQQALKQEIKLLNDKIKQLKTIENNLNKRS